MVDALRAAHRRVKRGGLVIDARPDASRPPRLMAGGRVRATLTQSDDANGRDSRSDAAVERVLAAGLFRRTGERGVVWHGATFGDLAEVDDYLDDTARYAAFAPGGRRALLPFRAGPIRMRRAIKFEVLERL